MAGISLADGKARPDPAISWRWFCQVPTPQAMKTSLSVGMGLYAPPATYLEVASLPHMNAGVNQVFVQGRYNYYPKSFDVTAFDVTFYEDKDFRVYNFLQLWRNLVQVWQGPSDQWGNYGLPKDYKQTLNFFLLDYQGLAALQIRYEGVWPMVIANFDLHNDVSDRIRTHVTFAADNCYPVNQTNSGIFGDGPSAIPLPNPQVPGGAPPVFRPFIQSQPDIPVGSNNPFNGATT